MAKKSVELMKLAPQGFIVQSKRSNILPRRFNILPKRFNIVPKRFNVLPKR